MNIKKDFFKGISGLATKHNVEEKDIQVRLTLVSQSGNEMGELKYECCVAWSPKEETSYNEVMGNKIINLTETIVVPMLHQSMTKWARTLEVDFSDFSAFLFKYKENIAVAMYSGSKVVKTCPIEDLMQ